ncbi:MAG: hypothetical protein KDD62_01735 [Bdellovibrionales bacterium]|nr:hypothetical protein [Bdellovibrionales bacterium]
MNYFFSYLVLALVFLTGLPSEAHAQKRVCIDSEKNILVLKRNCKSPRYTEVSASTLSAPVLTVVTESTALELNSSESANISASCPSGTLATGGGVSIVDNDGLAIRRTIPNLNLDGWAGGATGTKNGASGILNVYVICAKGATIADSESE